MKASTAEQRKLLRQAHEARLQKMREERTARLIQKLEKHKIEFDKTDMNPADVKKAYKALKASKAENKKKNPKRRCENCNRIMKQQFIGLKHCKCGVSWSKSDGYFQRSPDMVFALERKITKKARTVSEQSKYQLYGSKK